MSRLCVRLWLCIFWEVGPESWETARKRWCRRQMLQCDTCSCQPVVFSLPSSFSPVLHLLLVLSVLPRPPLVPTFLSKGPYSGILTDRKIWLSNMLTDEAHSLLFITWLVVRLSRFFSSISGCLMWFSCLERLIACQGFWCSVELRSASKKQALLC